MVCVCVCMCVVPDIFLLYLMSLSLMVRLEALQQMSQMYQTGTNVVPDVFLRYLRVITILVAVGKIILYNILALHILHSYFFVSFSQSIAR